MSTNTDQTVSENTIQSLRDDLLVAKDAVEERDEVIQKLNSEIERLLERERLCYAKIDELKARLDAAMEIVRLVREWQDLYDSDSSYDKGMEFELKYDQVLAALRAIDNPDHPLYGEGAKPDTQPVVDRVLRGSGGVPSPLREPVLLFAQAMEKKLQCYDDDRGVRGWEDEDVGWLLERVRNEVKEATDSYLHDEFDNLQEEVVDIADFCMMIYDRLSDVASGERTEAGQEDRSTSASSSAPEAHGMTYVDIYSPPGTKMRLNTRRRHGSTWDQEHADKYLTPGRWYTLERADIHASSTDFYLEEVPGQRFNSVIFERPVAGTHNPLPVNESDCCAEITPIADEMLNMVDEANSSEIPNGSDDLTTIYLVGYYAGRSGESETYDKIVRRIKSEAVREAAGMASKEHLSPISGGTQIFVGWLNEHANRIESGEDA